MLSVPAIAVRFKVFKAINLLILIVKLPLYSLFAFAIMVNEPGVVALEGTNESTS